MVSSVRILTISSLSHLETNLWESCQDSSNDSPGAIFESRHDTMLRHPLHPYFSVVVYKQSYNNHSATIKIRKWHVEILRAHSGLRSCSSNVLFSRSVLGVVVLSPWIQTLSLFLDIQDLLPLKNPRQITSYNVPQFKFVCLLIDWIWVTHLWQEYHRSGTLFTCILSGCTWFRLSHLAILPSITWFR